MNCYRCNSVLDLQRDNCTKCGTDVRHFKKIVYASNRYYNDGLQKAQARDLTGAREALKASLSLYKKNTQARNLLGLVEYAMGESAEALKEWVISKKYSSNRNMADRYINNLRRNMQSLDSEGHGIRKYNQALNYARNGSKDLATIQLKKVVSVHSNMIKAYELLALIYMEDGKYEQARKVLNRCLEVDRGNMSAIRYLKELDAMQEKSGSRSAGLVGDDDREQLIIPVRFRDYGSYLANAIYILLGAAIGLAIAWYVIVPGKVGEQMENANADIRSYESKISDLQASLSEIERESIRESQSVEASIEASLAEDERESSVAESLAEAERETFPERPSYDKFADNLAAVGNAAYENGVGNHGAFLNIAAAINQDELTEAYKYTYREILYVVANPSNINGYFEEAMAMAGAGNYADAAYLFEGISYFYPDSPPYLYMAAVCNEAGGNTEKAANQYWQVATLFPEYEFAKTSREKYLALKGVDEFPEPLEGTDLDALRAPIDFEAKIAALNLPEIVVTEPQPEETAAPEETPAAE